MVENFLKKNKWFLIVLAILVGFYVRQETLILSMPLEVDFVTIAFAILSAIGIHLYFHYKKKRNQALHFAKLKRFPKPKKKNNIENILNFLSIIFVSFVLFIVIKLVFNYAVIKHAETTHLTLRTIPIEDCVRGKYAHVTFTFEGEKCSLPYNPKEVNEAEIVRNYVLKLQYSRSYFNSAVIDNQEVLRK
ncbi:hypothetical protein [Flavobacterium sp. 3HN19-14]|uniref:hypothetical protein n=1 Tax=Flavobacterium sp. 3HN19-14 TaxID=3448133 RepID=UPI003EE40A3C